MIIEDYVSFDTAKLLKEKGFCCKKESIAAMYGEDGEFYSLSTADPYHFNWDDFDENDYIAPTLQMVMKWLREIHSIDISIGIRFWNTDEDTFVKSWKYTVYRTDEIEDFGQLNTYEEACEAAIKYCLNNLI